MIISLIAALAKNRVIGSKNKIPWYLPADLRHFKQLTMGHTVIMGRKTFESLGKPLPGRTNIVITHDKNFPAPGSIVVNSFEEALEKSQGEKVFVMGGEQIYKLAMPYAKKLYLTFLDTELEGDVFFPEFKENDWRLISAEVHERDPKNQYNYSFRVYEKKSG